MTTPTVSPVTPFAVPDSDRLHAALERVVELILPRVMGQLACFIQWEYRVAVVTPGKPILLSLVPVDPVRCPFGPLPAVPMWKDASGSPSVPVVGSIVTVGFHDGNPAKPAVMQVDPSVPTVPPATTYVSPTPLTLAGALVTFATPLSTGATDPAVKTATLGLLTALAPLL